MMAKLYFYYSAMNAGKSTTLIQSSYNYQERNMRTLVWTSALDNRYQVGKIASRIGITMESLVFYGDTDFFSIVEGETRSVDCILIDEAQFLHKQQVYQLTQIVDKLNIPVLCYGIRTDFRGELFEGSHYLLAWSDVLQELKTVCHCGKKATFVLRINGNDTALTEGEQIEIGGNEKYISVCRKHFNEKIIQY